ncbi:hypothetical protein BGZ58_005207 [Dissophora ornata]|nr:hypothetical protein BGZ58_005207 [Dissophora ornata]
MATHELIVGMDFGKVRTTCSTISITPPVNPKPRRFIYDPNKPFLRYRRDVNDNEHSRSGDSMCSLACLQGPDGLQVLMFNRTRLSTVDEESTSKRTRNFLDFESLNAIKWHELRAEMLRQETEKRYLEHFGSHTNFELDCSSQGSCVGEYSDSDKLSSNDATDFDMEFDHSNDDSGGGGYDENDVQRPVIRYHHYPFPLKSSGITTYPNQQSLAEFEIILQTMQWEEFWKPYPANELVAIQRIMASGAVTVPTSNISDLVVDVSSQTFASFTDESKVPVDDSNLSPSRYGSSLNDKIIEHHTSLSSQSVGFAEAKSEMEEPTPRTCYPTRQSVVQEPPPLQLGDLELPAAASILEYLVIENYIRDDDMAEEQIQNRCWVDLDCSNDMYYSLGTIGDDGSDSMDTEEQENDDKLINENFVMVFDLQYTDVNDDSRELGAQHNSCHDNDSSAQIDHIHDVKDPELYVPLLDYTLVNACTPQYIRKNGLYIILQRN